MNCRYDAYLDENYFSFNYITIITQHAVSFQPFVTSSYERDETSSLASPPPPPLPSSYCSDHSQLSQTLAFNN